MADAKPPQAAVPSVDKLLRSEEGKALTATFGRQAVTDAVRQDLTALRKHLSEIGESVRGEFGVDNVISRVKSSLEAHLVPSLKEVFNLTGTVVHTNLGRAPMPPEALDAVAAVAGGASNLEYNVASGRRGDRDDHLDDWLCNLTGAEAATVVNNNAAAVLLVLNALALRKEVLVSRGELIEIGGAFRMPDIMVRAGCKLVEVGTTNRTHLRDFADAIGSRTALLMKVHTSNYEVQGFTATVAETQLSQLAHDHTLPFVVDLGSGTLTNLERFGLPHEPTASETLSSGADIVTFSGDKLLGGPQAGIIVGRADLISKIKKNPMKRAMRCDKMTIAALSAILRLYANPDQLVQRVPVLRLLARSADDILACAQRLLPALTRRTGKSVSVEILPCKSLIGSGSLPSKRLESQAIVLRLNSARRSGAALNRIAAAFRALPIPVIGRIQDDAFWLDLRCLEMRSEKAFVEQLELLRLHAGSGP